MPDKKHPNENIEEILFEDGIANAGKIFRRGNAVVRPLQPQTRSVHRFLKHLQDVGFSAAPAPLAINEGTELISFMPGVVPTPPYPDWCLKDELIYEIAKLQHSFHEASSTFKPSPDCMWDASLADPGGLGIICHNDLGPGNVVFNNGKPTGFIDFDFCAPGNPMWDAARSARAWIPLDSPENAANYGFPGVNAISRLKAFCEGYGMSKTQRMEMLALMNECDRISVQYVEDQMKSGKPAYVRIWQDYNLEELYKMRTQWIKENHIAFANALA